MGELFKKLGATVYERVILSYRSTLFGLAAAAGVIAIDQLTTYLQSLPKFSGSAIAALVFVLGAQAKAKLQTAASVLPAPRGFSTVRLAILLAVVSFGLSFAAMARADDVQPGGILPSAGVCNGKGTVCLQPAVTVVPILIDFRSGNVSHDIGFGFGYGIVFPKVLGPNFTPGVDFLGGVQTGGGWLAAVMPRLGAIRLGPVLSHQPNATYAGLGVGTGM